MPDEDSSTHVDRPRNGRPFASSSQQPSGAPALSPPPIPDHELIQRIGGGSYGEVWLARNFLGTLRAVKIVHRRTFEEKDAFDREFNGLQKFEPISRTHEGLEDILQVGRTEDCLYYVMELADPLGVPALAGQPLENEDDSTNADAPPAKAGTPYQPRTLRADLAQRGRLPAAECIDIGLKLTSALAHLHQHGLVHRDVKPSNIIFVNGQPKLADIGLVAETSEARSFVGTVGFIPPEGPGTPQADLYSLGKVLYEASTGMNRQEFPKLPGHFHEFVDHEQLAELNEVILKACEEHPKVRYATSEKMHEHLLRVQRGKSVRRVLWLEQQLGWLKRVAAIGILPVILGGVIYWQAQQPEPATAGQLSTLFSELKLHRGDTHREKEIQGKIASTLRHLPKPESLIMDLRNGPRLRFSPNGNQVLAFDQDSVVDVYDLEFGRSQFSVAQDFSILLGGFSSDGNLIFAVTQDGQGHFWQATSGQSILPHQFRDDFSDPQASWQPIYEHPSMATNFTFTHTNGSLRIQARPGNAETKRAVALVPQQADEVYSDMVISIDIVDWDENLRDLCIALLARAEGQQWGVRSIAGAITFNDTDFRGRSSIGIGRGYAFREEHWEADPKKSYRLIFSLIGRTMHLNLYELNNPKEPVKLLTTIEDEPVTPGYVAVWVNTTIGHGAVKGLSPYDVTVDNFVVTGITP